MDQVIFSGRQCCEGNILILNLAAIAFQEVFVGTNSYAFGISCPNFFIIIILYLILSLRIKKVYRCELRSWKSIQLGLYLGNASMWKTLRTQLPKTSGQQCTQQPTCEEFASMLEGLFVGPVAIVRDAPPVLEQPWTLEELRLAIKRLKLKKSPDETGLTAELLKAVPETFLVQTLAAFNVILESGRIRDTWKFTTFRMLPKKLCAIHTTDFRPIASSGFSTRYLGI